MEKNVKPEIVQNLKDAGCDEKTIDSFCECDKKGKEKAKMKLLKEHRQGLLKQMHEEQKRIDCLDYLVFQLEKEIDDKQKEKKDD